MEIAVRAYAKSLKGTTIKRRVEHSDVDFSRYIVIDTETRVSSPVQELVFGSFALYQGEVLERIGLFYDPEVVTKNELAVLKAYCSKEPLIKLYAVREFIDGVFYPLVYKEQVPCVGFNLPFDISRLAIGYGFARRSMKSGFVLKLSEAGGGNPPIVIKQVNSTEAFIRFQTTSYSHLTGNFVDCQRIAAILTDSRHISLKQACKRFNKTYQKIEVEEHGELTLTYLQYNISDTLANAELFRRLKAEVERFEVNLPLTRLYSSASLGKVVLEKLGIMPQPIQGLKPEVYGQILQAYYGGRVECRLREQPVRVDALDFTSMYPTLFILLGLYDFLIAEHIDHFEDTAAVQKLIDGIKLTDLQNPEIWKTLNVIVELAPADTLLPVRARYDSETFTVGFNYLTSSEPLYYGLPSVILSKLLSGETPRIKRALRFIPVGKQKTLRTATILGTKINPLRDNVFKMLVEEKQKSKLAKDGRDRQLKILVNSFVYGVYIELNREEEASDVNVFSGNIAFREHKRLEKEGKYFNPLISTLITDGAKLLLGIGDCILQTYGEVPAYLDTDSLYIPTKYTEEVLHFYEPLNPYDKQLIPNILKVEENSTLLFAQSAKRYVLYQVLGNDFVISDAEHDEGYSLHGLGHLLPPFGDAEARWQKQVWIDILKLHYGKMCVETFLDKYRPFYAISQFTVSTSNLMRRFAVLNKGKSYRDSIKPFSFFLIGFGNTKEVKPIAAFSRDPQTMPYSKFINYKTGETMEGQHYFKTLADELWIYINHPESKLLGTKGRLERRHIIADKLIFIGKEADKIDEHMNGLGNAEYNVYHNPEDVAKPLSLSWERVKSCGIPKSQFYALKKQLRQGKRLKLSRKTLEKLNSLDLGDKNDL
jgi:hypothetical protein